MRYLFSLLVVFFSSMTFAATPLFYSLPLQNAGDHLAVEKLYLGADGGLWFKNIFGEVTYYDGANILPREGSALTYSSSKLAYNNNRFWTFKENIVYEQSPGTAVKPIVTLSSNSKVTNLGYSNGFLWFTDQDTFYSYELESTELTRLPLGVLEHYTRSPQSILNNAIRVGSRWVLATTEGIFTSDEDHFQFVAQSKGFSISSLYYSKKRRELLVGSAGLVTVVDIFTNQPIRHIPTDSTVTAIEETETGYWIGTEDGIVIDSFIESEVQHIRSVGGELHSLPSNRILDLLNDGRGGIWVATSKGVVYHSLFSDAFSRIDALYTLFKTPIGEVNQIIASGKEDFLIASELGILRLHSGNLQRLARGRVYSVAQNEGQIWGIRNNNLILLDNETLHLFNYDLLEIPKPTLALTDSLDSVWLASDKVLVKVVSKTSGIDRAAHVEQSIPLPKGISVESLDYRANGDILMGTSNGVLIFDGEQLAWLSEQEKLGKVLQTSSESSQSWLVSDHGLFLQSDVDSPFIPISMLEPKTRAVCVVNIPTDSSRLNSQGAWLISSKGLSNYDANGQVTKHFGAPYGLLNNEFSVNTCAINRQGTHILMVSNYGLVLSELSYLNSLLIPESTVLVSQVLVGRDPVSLLDEQPIEIKYGRSLSFLFGSLPEFGQNKLEYRFASEGEEQWSSLPSSRLTFDYLKPGEHTLEVRVVSSLPNVTPSTYIPFVVLEPWYLETQFIALSITLILLTLLLMFLWRSRVTRKNNAELKRQVQLKTSQLQQQSRVLLSSNQQLRKLTYARQLLFSNAISASKSLHQKQYRLISSQPEWLEKYGDETLKAIEGLSLLNAQSVKGTEQTKDYNIADAFDLIVETWCDELVKFGVSIDIDFQTPYRYLQANTHNLDLILNIIVADALKRGKRSQTVSVTVTADSKNIVITILDGGRPFDSTLLVSKQLSSTKGSLRDIVENSGGGIALKREAGQNQITLSWPFIEKGKVEQAQIQEIKKQTKSESRMIERNAWIQRVKATVEENFSEPSFSTAVIAELLFISERNFQRRFKQVMNKTFTEYLLDYRLDKACELLSEGKLVSDVAFSTGFNDPSYFTMRFKQQFGITPSQFVQTA